MPWQKVVILGLFAVDAAGIRLIRWALIGIAKKNGKTELAAALGLFFLIGSGEPSPRVVVAASSDKQADLVFGAAATMCRMSPTLSRITEVYGDEIRVPSIPGARLERVAAASGTNDGLNIYVVIIDEFHEWTGKKGRDVWNILTNGTAARREPMVLHITTAGSDEDTICYEQYAYGEAVNAGEIHDPQRFHHWIQPAGGLKADHKSRDVWKEANPSWGITMPRPDEYMASQLATKSEATVRRYNLNQWTLSEEIWEAASLWDALADPAIVISPKQPLYVAVDVGVKHDSSAVSCTQRVGGRLPVQVRIWENPRPPGSKGHDEWKLDIAEVEDHLRGLYRLFPKAAMRDERGIPLPGPAFYYDPHFFERSAQDLKHEGLNMLEYPQADSRMIPASQTLFELVKTGVVAHDGDPGLRRHIRNVVARQKPRGWRIDRPQVAGKHVDAAIATAIAVYEASRQPEVPAEAQAYSWEDMENLAKSAEAAGRMGIEEDAEDLSASDDEDDLDDDE